MKKPWIVALAVTVALATSTFGFDGNRKGFVLGGGLGFSPYSSWSGDGTFGVGQWVIHTSENGAGPGLNFVIGHAWSEQNMIVFEMNMTGWNSDQLASQPSITQGINGAVWYHYFGKSGRSMFTAAGLGFYRFISEYSTGYGQNAGPGLMLGGGYEFARHWQMGGYLGWGRSSERYGNWNYTHLNILVSAVAF